MIKTLHLSTHTTLYRFGTPLRTEAVVHKFDDDSFVLESEPKHLSVSQNAHGTNLRLDLTDDDRIYGLGEMMGTLNRRNGQYRIFSKSEAFHTPDRKGLYSANPFFFIQGERSFGVFIDFPSEIYIDAGFAQQSLLDVFLPSQNFDLYLFDLADPRQIIREYLKLTGAPAIPPRWAFGYQQCRYSYPDATTVRSIARNFRDKRIPCDAIYLDIDYMRDYKVFTVDSETFPEFATLVKELKDEGFKTVTIIDPGVKIESGYPVYESGKARDHFCKDAEGKEFVGAVWPGLTAFPDFMNAECRTWWASLYDELIAHGVEGFWNDMNEPEIMYTPESLEKLKGLLAEIQDKTDFGKDPVGFLPRLWEWWNNESFWDGFYHRMDDGTVVKHRDVHNLYGFNMVRATAQGIQAARPHERYFLLSRSAYAGLHRFAVVWTGDNHSWWEHMLTHMRMMMSLNMAGYFYNGADIGGHSGDCSAELLIRWMQVGIFTPLYRNHSVKNSRDQEPWAYDERTTDILRDVVSLRYALFPYFYSEFINAVHNLTPFISPLLLHYNDPAARQVEDQFMFGSSIMAAPVHVRGARGRFVYVPEGQWLLWKARNWEERKLQPISSGTHYVEAGMDETPMLLKENSLVALCKPQNYIDEKDPEALTVLGFVSGRASTKLYFDKNETFDFKSGKFSTLTIDVRKEKDSYVVTASKEEHNTVPVTVRSLLLEIYDESGNLVRLTKDI